ncbi:Flp pilus assembly complex ATPase component TadA [Candidatus Berkelbacteria bacterium]|nr:Flp pilus assembly complex ATPase component TadA [Candidatus Berkelbacteria bacterium]
MVNPQAQNNLEILKKTAAELGLELVALTQDTPEQSALALVPEALARQYQLLPLTLKEKSLTLVLTDPALLTKPAPKFLQELKQNGYHLRLQLTSSEDFQTALGAYRPQVNGQRPLSRVNNAQSQNMQAKTTVQAGPQPVTSIPPVASPALSVPASVHSAQVELVILKSREVPLNVLNKFPQDVAKKYQMVVFELSADGQEASVAALKPNDRRIREILKFIEARNKVRIHLFSASKEDIEGVLKQYDTEHREDKKPAQAPTPISSISTPPAQKSAMVSAPLKPSFAPTILTPSVKPNSVSRIPPKPVSAPLPVVPKRPILSPLPTPLAARPVTPIGPKIGGLTPAQPIAPETPNSLGTTDLKSYQEAIIRNSATLRDPSTPVPTVEVGDLQLPTNQLGVGELPEGQAPIMITNIGAEDKNLDIVLGTTVETSEQLEQILKSGMVPKIVAAIVFYATAVAASDIHMEAGEKEVRIRFRVDGTLQEIIKLPVQLLAPIVSRIKILAKLKIDESRIPQDGRFGVIVQKREIDLRVSTLPTVFGEKVVMRILDKEKSLKKLTELGIQGTNLARIQSAIKDPFGIILVTGPTGSGKTTTLYAMLTELNTASVNIVTLEDPVEYQLDGINQTQVKPKIGFGFADGLRSILRQDPNIIMVGEIRDGETAGLATQAALTGHLVLSTLHTNDSSGALPRMIDMHVEPFLLASSVNIVIAQRLIRRLCSKCRQPASIPAETLTRIQQELASAFAPELKSAASKQLSFFGPNQKGCNVCHNGYKGRVGIYEVLITSPAIADLVLAKSASSKIAAKAHEEGMITLREDGILKAMQGETSLDEVIQATSE